MGIYAYAFDIFVSFQNKIRTFFLSLLGVLLAYVCVYIDNVSFHVNWSLPNKSKKCMPTTEACAHEFILIEKAESIIISELYNFPHMNKIYV